MQDWLGSTKITPDALGRAQKVQYPDGREVSYTYGKAGERRSMTYPDGKTVFYGYDEQLRLSELKEGDSIINYGYDPLGRLCEKQFPNGTKTTYTYDRKDQLTELVHRDQEGILDRYTYLYDLLGNKTGITKERRGLEQESGSYTYGYDALGRLSEIQKDGQMQTRYGYDAFGNRTWKEESGERTSYQYNVINQMVSEKHGELLKAYSYDKRGNLTGIQENGAWKKQYVYGAINRLEEAVDAAGKQARYQYNGLGHRVGKQEGVLPKEKLEKLAPQSRIGMEIGNSRQITYTLDLTRQYYNLLERTEESRSQRYFWDGNVAAYEENGERNYYLQDELGSPLRIEDSAGNLRESYGYGVFGEDLYQNQEKIQPFGYTGYQKDEIAGTYYAQAREYLAENGRFAGQDLIKGFIENPVSINRYIYCQCNSLNYIDLTGKSREDARNYMEKYGTDLNEDGEPDETNSNYPMFKSNCANFVSQTLVAGGIEPVKGEWYITTALNENLLGGLTLKVGAFVHRLLGNNIHYNNTVKNHDVLLSDTWNDAKAQYDYFSNPDNGYINGEVIHIKTQEELVRAAKEGNIQTGDLLYWDRKGKGVTHASIISKVAGDEILFAGNTRARFDYSVKNALGDYKGGIYIIKIKDEFYNNCDIE